MSDGPYKSLPQKRHWKKVAERAERTAFATEQVGEELLSALAREFQDTPMNTIRHILQSHPQQVMFSDPAELSVEALENLRQQHRGSKVTNDLIDEAQAAVRDGLFGDDACQRAVEFASSSTLHSHLRSMEEHYLRKTSATEATRVRDRLQEAHNTINASSFAQNVVASDRNGLFMKQPVKHQGIDEGPQMP